MRESCCVRRIDGSVLGHLHRDGAISGPDRELRGWTDGLSILSRDRLVRAVLRRRDGDGADEVVTSPGVVVGMIRGNDVLDVDGVLAARVGDSHWANEGLACAALLFVDLACRREDYTDEEPFPYRAPAPIFGHGTWDAALLNRWMDGVARGCEDLAALRRDVAQLSEQLHELYERLRDAPRSPGGEG